MEASQITERRNDSVTYTNQLDLQEANRNKRVSISNQGYTRGRSFLGKVITDSEQGKVALYVPPTPAKYSGIPYKIQYSNNNNLINFGYGSFGLLPPPITESYIYVTNKSYFGQRAFNFLPNQDFTVEWFHYEIQSAATVPRVWNFGITATFNNLGCSMEFIAGQDSLVCWFNSTYTVIPLGSVPRYNKWMHVAYSRQGSTLRVFINGNLVSTQAGKGAQNSLFTALRIGNVEGNPLTQFTGYITNFRWTRGMALYTSSFTPVDPNLQPMDGPQPGYGTTCLFKMASSDKLIEDSSPVNLDAINIETTWGGGVWDTKNHQPV